MGDEEFYDGWYIKNENGNEILELYKLGHDNRQIIRNGDNYKFFSLIRFNNCIVPSQHPLSSNEAKELWDKYYPEAKKFT